MYIGRVTAYHFLSYYFSTLSLKRGKSIFGVGFVSVVILESELAWLSRCSFIIPVSYNYSSLALLVFWFILGGSFWKVAEFRSNDAFG